jgi:basic membrane protein A
MEIRLKWQKRFGIVITMLIVIPAIALNSGCSLASGLFAAPTFTPTSTLPPTLTPTLTSTFTPTPTPTLTPSPTATSTSTSTPTPEGYYYTQAYQFSLVLPSGWIATERSTSLEFKDPTGNLFLNASSAESETGSADDYLQVWVTLFRDPSMNAFASSTLGVKDTVTLGDGNIAVRQFISGKHSSGADFSMQVTCVRYQTRLYAFIFFGSSYTMNGSVDLIDGIYQTINLGEAISGEAASRPDCSRLDVVCVGLVTVGGINDQAFNQGTWQGIKMAATMYKLEADFIESKQVADYEKNIDAFAALDYDVIITVGFDMGEATGIKARQYPNIKFAIVDYQYFPTAGSAACPPSVKDCYGDGGLTNVTSLMFQEDQVGFLAGVLAAGMSGSGTVCSVSGIQLPPVERFVSGFQNGVIWNRPAVKALNVYLPSFNDPAAGYNAAKEMMTSGCDVVFTVAGTTGNGALQAAMDAKVMAIGVDADQYLTTPEFRSVLLSSAMKNVDMAVYEYLTSVYKKTEKAGVAMNDLGNGGVGLAPFHDWESKIPASVIAKIDEAIAGLKDGSISTGYNP